MEGSEKSVEKNLKENSNTSQAKVTVPIREYVAPIPFPQRLHKYKLDKQFFKFIEVFKKLQTNIPFVDALAQMASYATFMKEILINKRKLEDYEIIMLSEECYARLQNKLPPKLKDPRSFTIPCTIIFNVIVFIWKTRDWKG